MNINEIINNKILELQSLKLKRDNINNELNEINKFLEIINKLDKDMLSLNISKLKELLEKNNYYVSDIDKLFNNINNLIEFYVIKKDTILKLPTIYELKLNEIKDYLKEIKNKLENDLIDDLGNDEDLDNLKQILLIINGDKEIELSNKLLKTLYKYIITQLDDKEKINLYELLLNNKSDKKDLTEDLISSDDKVNSVDDIINLFEKCHSLSTVKRYINDNSEELMQVTNLNNSKQILKFLDEKGLLFYFDDIALIYVACYGNIENIKEVYEELLKINNSIGEELDFKPFCDIASVPMWLNTPNVSIEPYKKGAKTNEIIYPKNIKNKYLNISNIRTNIELIMGNLDLFNLDNLTKEKIYKNAIVRLVPPYVLKKNIVLARTYNLTNLNLSAVKNDMEKRINYAIELGLMKTPKLNSFIYVSNVTSMLSGSSDKLRKQFKGLAYFEYYTSNLSNFAENEFAYYTGILSNLGLNSLYRDFYNSDHSVSDHKQSIGYNKSNNYLDGFVNKDIIENGKYETDENGKTRVVIEGLKNYSEYSQVIDDFNNKYSNFNEKYFDPEIVYEPVIIEFERDFGIKDVETEDMIDSTFFKDEFVYKFKNKIISRYRVLRNATILKEKYGYLNKDLLLASILKDSFITEKEYKELRESQLFNELGFFESRS